MKESIINQPESYPAFIRFLAKAVSYVFHPLFIPTYIFSWLMLRFPFEFAGMTSGTFAVRLFSTFWLTAFFPAFAIFLAWRLKFIESIYLRSSKERILPYIITMFFYWWMWYLCRNMTDQPDVLQCFYLGAFFASIAGLIFNIFTKISMHAMGISGGFVCILITSLLYQTHLGIDIAIVTVLMGVVCSARLILREHSPFEIYLGMIIGILSQIIGFSLSL